MSDFRVKGTDLTSIADAIRTKGSTSAEMTFPDGFISAIGNIPTGGGSTLITKSITANGTYNASSDNADGYSSVTVGVSNRLMIGTFKGTTAGAAIAVNIPYTGNGYPVAGIVFPSGGTMVTDIAQLVQNYVHVMFAFAKNDTEEAPTYDDTSSSKNKASVLVWYKNSSSDPLAWTTNGVKDKALYQNNNATSTNTNVVRFKNDTTMSVFIADASYGIPNNIEYTYMIVYSE